MRRKEKHPDLVKLGKRIAGMREAKGLRQSDIENLDPKYLSDIERGLSNPSYTTLLKIADFLGCGVGDLLKF